jgi:glycosyltransferase involved in cell wall biosynthesis
MPKNIVLTEVKAEKRLKIAHFCQFAPKVSGMYISTKEQIKYERRAGLESELIEPYNEVPPSWMVDGWLKPNTWKWAIDADVWVLHRLIPPSLNAIKHSKGTVFVLHGSAEMMLLTEYNSEGNNTALNMNISNLWEFDKTIALCPHDYEIMRLYDENCKLEHIQDAIDLEEYTPEGYKWEYEKHPALISTDTMRLTKLPAHIMWAMPKIAERIPDARLNYFSYPRLDGATWRNILVRSKKQDLSRLTETIVMSGISDLRPFIRGGDIGFINEIHGRAGRTAPEKMAMGVPVVSYMGDYTKYHAVAWNLDSIAKTVEKLWSDLQDHGERIRKECVAYAQENFSMEKATQKYIKIYEEVRK